MTLRIKTTMASFSRLFSSKIYNTPAVPDERTNLKYHELPHDEH